MAINMIKVLFSWADWDFKMSQNKKSYKELLKLGWQYREDWPFSTDEECVISMKGTWQVFVRNVKCFVRDFTPKIGLIMRTDPTTSLPCARSIKILPCNPTRSQIFPVLVLSSSWVACQKSLSFPLVSRIWEWLYFKANKELFKITQDSDWEEGLATAFHSNFGHFHIMTLIWMTPCCSSWPGVVLAEGGCWRWLN